MGVDVRSNDWASKFDGTIEQQAGEVAGKIEMTDIAVKVSQPITLKAGLNDTWFAWSGPTDKAGVGYFRVQGPTVVIEYAPQGGTDHVHTVIRSPDDDYGAGSAK